MSTATMHSERPAADVPKEWHKQPTIWIVLGVLGFTFVSSIVLVWLAAQNPPQLVVEDYTAINEISAQERARDQRARELGLRAAAEFGAAENNSKVSVRLTGNSAFVAPQALELRIRHSTRAEFDENILLQRRGAGFYGEVMLPASPFTLVLNDPTLTWRLSARVPGPVARLELDSRPISNPAEQP